MTDEKKPLTRKQKVFVAEYLKCWNASEAARRAGYSEKTAYAIGSENLRKPEIKAAIEACLAEIQMSADEAKTRLTDVARADIGVFFKLVDEWTFYPLPSSEILEYQEVVEEKEGKDGKKEQKVRTSYRVRRVVLDVDKLLDPKYSKLLKRFTDSPKNGLAVEMYDAQEARRDILKMKGEFKEKVELTGKDGEALIPKEDHERNDRAISTLADALREIVSGTGSKQNGEMDTTK